MNVLLSREDRFDSIDTKFDKLFGALKEMREETAERFQAIEDRLDRIEIAIERIADWVPFRTPPLNLKKLD